MLPIFKIYWKALIRCGFGLRIDIYQWEGKEIDPYIHVQSISNKNIKVKKWGK